MSYQGGKYFRVGFFAGVHGVKYNDIQARELFVMEAKRFTDNTFETIARWRSRQLLLRNGQTKTSVAKSVSCRQHRNAAVGRLTARCTKHVLKVFR